MEKCEKSTKMLDVSKSTLYITDCIFSFRLYGEGKTYVALSLTVRIS